MLGMDPQNIVQSLLYAALIIIGLSLYYFQSRAFKKIGNQIADWLSILSERFTTTFESLDRKIEEQSQLLKQGNETDSISILSERFVTTLESLTRKIEEQSQFQKNQLNFFNTYIESSTQKTESRLEKIHEILESRITALEKMNAEKLDKIKEIVDEKLSRILSDISISLIERMAELQEKTSDKFDLLKTALSDRLSVSIEDVRNTLSVALEALKDANTISFNSLTNTLENSLSSTLKATSETTENKLEVIRSIVDEKLHSILGQSRDTLDSRLALLQDSNVTQLSNIRSIVDDRLFSGYKELAATLTNNLKIIKENNDKELQAIRFLVDEKLQTSLEKRLGEAFGTVADRLEKVHQGIGEMKTLTHSVGDLKKVLSNTKVRGTWGEVQLGYLLVQMLSPEQFGMNVAIGNQKSGHPYRVEYAIRLPGQDRKKEVLLPIDSKFPLENYQRLIQAMEDNNTDLMTEYKNALRSQLLAEAKKIGEKYIVPPETTDFAILYMPTEGLFAEALRIDNLSETIMREYRIILAGPTTLTALLNSLQVGFKTLMINKRSVEVWNLLKTVKTEFYHFGEILDKTQKRIEEAGNSLGIVSRKTKTLEKQFDALETMPKPTESKK